MCGQTAAFALLREGVRNLRCVDRAPRGREGPWATYARMEILRSPKHLTGPDYGVPSLTYRAWHEAKFGAAHWEKLHKIARLDWAEYLLWVRDTAGLPVENDFEVVSLNLNGKFMEVKTKTVHSPCEKSRPGPRTRRQRRACAGRASRPSIRRKRKAGVFHSADDIDFKALKGKRVGILGIGSSAFDNAGEALEAGAAEVVMFARRADHAAGEQVEVDRLSGLPARLRVARRRAAAGASTPTSSASRCRRLTKACSAARSMRDFRLRFSEGWKDISQRKKKITTSKTRADTFVRRRHRLHRLRRQPDGPARNRVLPRRDRHLGRARVEGGGEEISGRSPLPVPRRRVPAAGQGAGPRPRARVQLGQHHEPRRAGRRHSRHRERARGASRRALPGTCSWKTPTCTGSACRRTTRTN